MDRKRAIEGFDVMYLIESVYLLHVSVNREEGHIAGILKRFQRSIRIIEELK